MSCMHTHVSSVCVQIDGRQTHSISSQCPPPPFPLLLLTASSATEVIEPKQLHTHTHADRHMHIHIRIKANINAITHVCNRFCFCIHFVPRLILACSSKMSWISTNVCIMQYTYNGAWMGQTYIFKVPTPSRDLEKWVDAISVCTCYIHICCC